MQLNKALQNLTELDVTTRITRLKHALATLNQHDGDLQEKYLAAWSVVDDGQSITRKMGTLGLAKPNHPALADPKLSEKIDQWTSRGKQLAGPQLLTKSQLFFEGLEWWYRGRFGRGLNAQGLLKSPAAINSDRHAMVLLFPTAESNERSDSMDGPRNRPDYSRRHRHTWSWEYRRYNQYTHRTGSRQIGEFLGTTTHSLTSHPSGFGCQAAVFIENPFLPNIEIVSFQGTDTIITRSGLQLDPIDSRAPRRIVGYLEYGKALENLEQLASMASPEDIEAFDAIIGEQDQFAVFRKPGFESVGEKRLADDSENKPQLGLAWVVALARLEYGAILAGFSRHPEPFYNVQPERFAWNESMQLLLEGVSDHLTELQNTDKLNEFAETQNDLLIMALSLNRRIGIARAMLQPLANAQRPRYTAAQEQQLATNANELEKKQRALNSSFAVMRRVR